MKPEIVTTIHPKTHEVIYSAVLDDTCASYTKQELRCSKCGCACKTAIFTESIDGKKTWLLCFARKYKSKNNYGCYIKQLGKIFSEVKPDPYIKNHFIINIPNL